MTFSIFDESSELLNAASSITDRLSDIAQNAKLDGCEVTIVVTKVEHDGGISHAILSTIEDHEELLTTLDNVVEDRLGPYAEPDTDDDQPELPLFTKGTLH